MRGDQERLSGGNTQACLKECKTMNICKGIEGLIQVMR